MIYLLERYEAVIFDMDGTLIDSMPSHMESWRYVANKHGYPFDLEWQNSLGGVSSLRTAELIVERYNLEIAPSLISQDKQEFWEAMAVEPILIRETYDLLEQLIGRKPIAIGTGSDRTHATELLAQTGILVKLDSLVTASDVSNGKPNPDTYLKAADLLNVAPEHCVVFEDTEIGRQAALAAGMDCILVKDNRIQWPEPLAS